MKDRTQDTQGNKIFIDKEERIQKKGRKNFRNAHGGAFRKS